MRGEPGGLEDFSVKEILGALLALVGFHVFFALLVAVFG
jgi:hypothetical protein